MQLQICTTIAALFISFICILLLIINTEDIKGTVQLLYGIVLDAGSSHTSMFIYNWPADKQNCTGIVSQHSGFHAK
ncbi:hypothetical protein cypCar_00034897, partial [Cyprinus carpio]